MNDAGSKLGRRVVLGGLGVAAAGAGGTMLPVGLPGGAAASRAGRSGRRDRFPNALPATPTSSKHLRLPASAFRPTSSASVWQISGGALLVTGSATFAAPIVLPEGDLIEEVDVVLDPGGHSGAITLSRFQPGHTEVLATMTYPATSGVTTAYLPLPDRPHVAEPSAWSYELDVELSNGAALQSAVVEYFGGSSTLVLLDPVRVYDSRDAQPYKLLPTVTPIAKLAAGGSIGFSLQGVVPVFNRGALVNVTLDQTEGGGYLTVFGEGETGAAPPTSNVNWYAANQVVANLVITTLGGEAGLTIRAGGTGRTHVIVDVLGYFV